MSMSDAIRSLRPGAMFVLRDGQLIRWDTPDIPPPSPQEIEAEQQRLEAERETLLAQAERERQREAGKRRAIELAAQEVLAPKVLSGELPPEDYAAVADLYDEWAPGLEVKAGQILNRDGVLYSVGQDHVTSNRPEEDEEKFAPHRPRETSRAPG
jgi:hypothetical protein